MEQFRRDLASNANGSEKGEFKLSHGGVVSLQTILNTNANQNDIATTETDTGTIADGTEIILISQNPNSSLSCAYAHAYAHANTTVNGWDILLPPSLAHTIFLALAHGKDNGMLLPVAEFSPCSYD